jgi:hypothetical protein
MEAGNGGFQLPRVAIISNATTNPQLNALTSITGVD